MTDYMKEIMKRGSKVKLVEVAYEENAAEISGKTIVKEIYVKGKLVNLAVKG